MQPWEQEFLQICIENKIEPVISKGNDYLLVVPKLPSKEVQDRLRAIIPSDIQYRYSEGPRVITTEGLRAIFMQLGVQGASIEMKGHDLILQIDMENFQMVEESSPIWNSVNKLISSDSFVENWKAIVNDKVVYDSKTVKTMANQTRPEREICPTKEEIMDLRIILENCKDANDFINSI
jgi:hypothetical protein